MRKSLLVTVLLAAAIGCAPLAMAIAQGAPGWHGHRGMAMGARMYGRLNLTDTQRSQIKQFRHQNFTQMKAQMQALHAARQAFRTATPGTAAYQSATSSLAQAEASAASARVTQRANLRAQIYEVLTPAQRSQLAQMQAQRAARMRRWKEFQQENPLPQSSAQ